MTNLSPTFTSSLELMGHAIEHLKNNTPKDLKLAVLHADNAIELLLKELAKYNGIRLINKKGYPISHYECIDRLEAKGIKIPRITDIDILHTERNVTYHLGDQPDIKKAKWLVYKLALNIMTNICEDKFDYDVNEFPKEPNITYEIEETESEIKDVYLNDALNAFKAKIFNASIIASYTAIEVFLREGIPVDLRKGIEELKVQLREELFEDDLLNIIKLRDIKNKILYEGYSAIKEEAAFAIVFSNILIGGIDSVLM